MPKNPKKTLARLNPKNFVHNHPNLTIGIIAGLTATVMLQERGRKNWNAFMEEKGIDPIEFYTPEYYAELNNA